MKRKKGIITCCQIYYIKIEAMSVWKLAVSSSLPSSSEEREDREKEKLPSPRKYIAPLAATLYHLERIVVVYI